MTQNKRNTPVLQVRGWAGDRLQPANNLRRETLKDVWDGTHTQKITLQNLGIRGWRKPSGNRNWRGTRAQKRL